MTVSHANDSYFWVVTNFGDMEVQDGYRAQTFGTFVTGLAAMLNVYIIYFLFAEKQLKRLYGISFPYSLFFVIGIPPICTMISCTF